MKDKDGNKLTGKEYMARWKEGIAQITPAQRVENDLRATFIMAVGYLVGLISLFIFFNSFIVGWFTVGLILIFLGALYGQIVKLIGLYGQFKTLKQLEGSEIMEDIFVE